MNLDMLVKLYELPPLDLEPLRAAGIDIRRALAAEKWLTVKWVERHFGAAWASETDASFGHQPVACFLAIQQGAIVGFACYDAACKNFFGPTGVLESERGRGIGKALLLACLHAMAADGYAYAIIGAAGPQAFYTKAVGAIPIEGSSPGIYRGMLYEDRG